MSVFHNNVLSGAAGQTGGAAAANITKSLRFNSGDSAYLNRTPSSAGNRKTWTASFWVKICKSAGYIYLMNCENTNRFYLLYQSGYITVFNTSGVILSPDRIFKDHSAWYHMVIAFDTTQSTSTDRLKWYINGEEVSDYRTNLNTYPSQNDQTEWNTATAHEIGSRNGGSFGGIDYYLTDFYFIDGSQKEATDFGAFDDNGVWQAAAYSGTYGTNGFHLFDFANESGIGDDSSGNDNDFTANNITNVEANNTDGIDNVVNITQIQNNGTNVDVNLGNLQTMMNTSTFQDADTDNSTYGVRVAGTSKKFAVKWSGLTGLTGVSVRWQRAASYDPDVQTSGTGITTATTTLTSGRRQDTFATTSTTGQIVFEDVTTGNTKGFFIRAIEFKGYTGNIVYPTNVENFVLSGGADQDVLFDVPTNGDSSDDTGAGGEVSGCYATLNPNILGTYISSRTTLSQGNLKFVNSQYSTVPSTIAMSSGKWYCEGTVDVLASSDQVYAGLIRTNAPNNAYEYFQGNNPTRGVHYWGDNTGLNRAQSYGVDYGTAGTVIGIAFDADAGSCTWYVNGSSQGASTYNIVQGEEYYFSFGAYVNGAWTVNFGQRPFAYTAPSGYKALCTTNLPTPTIADGSDYFDTKLYTGNGSTQTISGLEFSPDFVWIKNRSSVYSHDLYDIVRGVERSLRSDTTQAESVFSTGLTAFTSDGFTVGSRGHDNNSGDAIAAWTWDAGSSTVSNTDGTITSSVRANQTAGFSIVSWTGTGSPGTIGHGLNSAPELIIGKNRGNTTNWFVGAAAANDWSKVLLLNSTAALATNGNFNSTAPTSSVFSVGTGSGLNQNTKAHIAYCFTSVAGYSAFGSYEGNGSATEGPFVSLNFAPAFLLVKRTDSTGNWILVDQTRGEDKAVYPNQSISESSASFTWVDFVSNGFKIRSSITAVNASGGDYIYWAIAENPFSSNGGLAR